MNEKESFVLWNNGTGSLFVLDMWGLNKKYFLVVRKYLDLYSRIVILTLFKRKKTKQFHLYLHSKIVILTREIKIERKVIGN